MRHLVERFSRGVICAGICQSNSKACHCMFRRKPASAIGDGIWKQPTPCSFASVRELVRPGSVVWDVGANVGLFSFSAAALAGPNGFVLAIEPDVWLAHLLARSAQRIQQHSAGAAPVAVLCAAASEANRIRQLQIAERARAANYLMEAKGSSQAGGYRYQQATVTVSLDFLLDYFPAPSVLKIDVETAEVNVLRGASRLLRTVRPVIWCEVAADNSETVSELLHQGAYELSSAAAEPAERTPLTRARGTPWQYRRHSKKSKSR